MVKKRTYIILIIIFTIFFLVMFVLFGIQNIKEEKQSAILIFGDNTLWSYNKREWLNLNESSSYDDLNWKNYEVFLNNEKIGNYNLWHYDKWYAFDNDNNSISLNGNLFAYNANYEINVYNFKLDQLEDNNIYVKRVLENNNLDTSSKFSSSGKVSFDFDNDGIIEDFYIISNVFAFDFTPDTIFSIVFMVKNDTIYSIYTDISSNDYFNGCKPFFNTFLDVNSDKKYEFVLSCGGYSISDRVDMLYKFDDKRFKIAVSNK